MNRRPKKGEIWIYRLCKTDSTHASFEVAFWATDYTLVRWNCFRSRVPTFDIVNVAEDVHKSWANGWQLYDIFELA